MPKPWELLIDFKNASLETGKNGADIADPHLQTASHVIFDNGVLEKAPGRTLKYTQLESGAQIDGLFRSYDKAGNQDFLVGVNGKIKYDTGSAFADLQTGLTVGKPFDFQNHKDRSYIVNGYDDALDFNPRTNAIQKAGLEPPRFFKKVAYFEVDETITGDGHSSDTTTFRTDERTGTASRSLKVTAAAAATKWGGVTYSAATNFSIFPNGKTVSDDDFLCISIFHRTLAYVSSIIIRFTTSTNNYYDATLTSVSLDPILQRNNQWTDVKIKRSKFVATGTPNWNSIAYVQFFVIAVTGEAVVNFDNCYFKNAPIEAASYRKDIETFDGPTSDWTPGAGTVSYSDNYKYTKKRYSLIVTNTNASVYKAVSPVLDLTVYEDGVTSQTSDEICLWVYIASTANLTNIILRLYSDTSTPKYFTYTYTGFNVSTTGGWNEIRVKKVSFTDFNANGASWAAINRIYIGLTTTGACTCYFDDWRLEENAITRDIATMETSELWSFSPTTGGGFNSDPKFVAHPGSATPSSIYLRVPAKKIYYANLDYTTLNLNQYAGSEVSGSDDLICFWMYWNYFSPIKKIIIKIDVNAADFSTDYFYYEITPGYLKEQLGLQNPKAISMQNKSLNIQISKSDFTRVGSTGGKDWNTSEAVRFVVEAVDVSTLPVKVYFDDLHMRRRQGLTGLYQWCMVNGDDEGTFSAPSEWSEQITVSGARAALRLLPTSADTRVTKRYIFRKGGDLGEESRLSFIIHDNTTTTYFDDVKDNLQGQLLEDEAIPSGTIRFPLFAKFGPEYKGRAVGYRDPNNLRRFYFSNRDFFYAWSELQAWDFPTELMNVWLDDDIYYFNTKAGIIRVNKDFGELTSDDFENTGIVKAAIGPWASTPCDEVLGMVAFDGVYLYNGLQHEYISEDVKNFFDSATYDLDAVIAFFRKRHLYLSVKTTGGVRSILECYLPERKWRTSDYSISAFCIFDGPTDSGELFFGTTTGYVYQGDVGYEDTMSVVTKDYPISSNPFEEVVISEVWVKARSASSTPGAISIQFRIDQTLNTSITKTFPASGNLTSVYTTYFAQLLAVEDYIKASKLGLSISHTAVGKHVAIEAIYLRGSVAELPKTLEE